MSESTYLTYYQKNRDVILNRANLSFIIKIIMKMIKRDTENKQEINIETYLKKKNF